MRFGNLTRSLAILSALTVSVWSVGCGGSPEEPAKAASDSANDAKDGDLKGAKTADPGDLLDDADDSGSGLDLGDDTGSGTGDTGLGLEDLDFSDDK